MLVKLNDYIMKWSLTKHQEWKPQLLDLIEKTKDLNNITLNNENYYYDWDVPDRKSKLYCDLYFHCITEPIHAYAKYFGLKPMTWPGKPKAIVSADIGPEHNIHYQQGKIPTPWFQQYDVPNCSFGWHSHDGSIAVLYFVELPNPKDATEFYKEGQFDVKEGDVLIWPSYLSHRSPALSSSGRKTIVSANVDLVTDRNLTGNGK